MALDFIKTDRERALEKAAIRAMGSMTGIAAALRDRGVFNNTAEILEARVKELDAALAFSYAPPDEPAEGTVYIADTAPPVAIGPRGYEHDGNGNPVEMRRVDDAKPE